MKAGGTAWLHARPAPAASNSTARTGRTSADQDGDAVHRVAAIALRVPVAGDMRLHHAGRIGAARPHLVVAVARQLHGRGPALPVVLVLRLGETGPGPGGAEIGRDVDLLDGAIAGPGGAAQFQLRGAGGELGAVGRAGH